MIEWKKSSNCVEVGWRKSSHCEGGACAEVAQAGGQVLLRDSKDPAGPVLEFSPGAWTEFLDGVKAAVPDVGPASLAEMPDPATLDKLVQRALPGSAVPPGPASGAAFSSAI